MVTRNDARDIMIVALREKHEVILHNLYQSIINAAKEGKGDCTYETDPDTAKDLELIFKDLGYIVYRSSYSKAIDDEFLEFNLLHIKWEEV